MLKKSRVSKRLPGPEEGAVGVVEGSAVPNESKSNMLGMVDLLPLLLLLLILMSIHCIHISHVITCHLEEADSQNPVCLLSLSLVSVDRESVMKFR